jgi:hypothetical protein
LTNSIAINDRAGKGGGVAAGTGPVRGLGGVMLLRSISGERVYIGSGDGDELLVGLK